ncbi:GDSL-type esterase/lipase family protein [Acetivibrio ethanolgignens]|uniref:SGNH hydrolase-type esterase domain-containing protein n=1 Tax=Acetivibrio ethanolgignens TaxID=290052 RepID=A0A0V8QAT2_9FIRM|nr:GDSL-type esterase/lipase family protein [Acetivibrio ethanolgignens]KSV57580.1 hypothetical protein ASU35_15805 [Acetivibrio ethanolgignens]
MKRYMYTIFLCFSCLIALPFITKKVFHLSIEKKVEAEEKEDIEIQEEVYYTISPEDRKEAEEPPAVVEQEKEEQPEEEVLVEKPEKKLEFTKVDKKYFKDALFIGDSRTVGLSEYADLGGADVFADSGMSVYKVFEKEIQIKGIGKTGLENLLKSKNYGKIYVMLGINELGYEHKQTVRKFKELVQRIQQLQPEAIIFIGANLHVTAEKSAQSDIYNNKNINRINKGIKKLADEKQIFYIDINEIFDDENGNLNAEYTIDKVHVLGKYYEQWAEWICTKGIVN